MAPLSRMFRPPSAGNTDTVFSRAHHQTCAFQRLSDVLGVFSSPDEAKDSKPRNRLGSFLPLGSAGRRDQRPPVLRCVRVVQPQPAVHNGLPGIDARTVGVVIRLEPFASQQLPCSIRKFSSSRPLSWCSTHSTLYWSLPSPGIRTRLEARHQLSRWPGSKSCSENTAARRRIFARCQRPTGALTSRLQNRRAIALAVFSPADNPPDRHHCRAS